MSENKLAKIDSRENFLSCDICKMPVNPVLKAYRGMVYHPYLLTKFQDSVIGRTTAHSQILRACAKTNSSKNGQNG